MDKSGRQISFLLFLQRCRPLDDLEEKKLTSSYSKTFSGEDLIQKSLTLAKNIFYPRVSGLSFGLESAKGSNVGLKLAVS